jgi:photosystem II stability/assembly factor-like uncharacterized protein
MRSVEARADFDYYSRIYQLEFTEEKHSIIVGYSGIRGNR